MDAAAVAAGLRDYATPSFEWRYAAAAPLQLLNTEGSATSVAQLLQQAPQTILVLGRNLL
jgi:hypothetical protein